MDTKLLIDAIVQQTTVLIAQISTAAGLRAPLAHIADQVFVELARELEAQGVGRKVVADMFGLALRSYQKRVQRLSESVTVRDRTLWEAVYEYIQEHPRIGRSEIDRRFRRDAAEHVGAVLNDLVQHGLVFATGRGQDAIYRIADAEDRAAFLQGNSVDALADLAWLLVYRSPGLRRSALQHQLTVEPARLEGALAQLGAQGRLHASGDADPELHAENFVIEVGAEQGWEAAVFDHFSTVAAAIAAKLRIGPRARAADVVGGATHSFHIHSGHPMEDEVRGQLQTIRQQVDELWGRVSAYNKSNPVPEEQKVKVSFYFGQNVSDAVAPAEIQQEDSQ